MDDRRFDSWSKALAARGSRRQAIARGSGVAMLGLLGLRSRANAQTTTGLGEDGICRMDFEAHVRLGPSVDDGANDLITGVLAFQIGDGGGITEGEMTLKNGNIYPVVGQATGRFFSMRIGIDDDTLVAIGAGEKNVRTCAGEYGGPTSGPLPGDLGDWKAFAEASGVTATATAGTSSSSSTSSTSSTSSSSGSSSQPASTSTESSSCPDSCADPKVNDPTSCECVCPPDRVECGPICCYINGICEDAATGKCTCPVDYQICGDVCVSTRCPFNTTWNDALCACSNICGVDSVCCDGICAELMTRKEHCGACGNACQDPYECVNGACDCPPGTLLCGSACTPVTDDPLNCGACGNQCGANQSCVNGACICNQGYTLCGDTCRDLLNDRKHCGSCAFQCGTFDSCILGVCT